MRTQRVPKFKQIHFDSEVRLVGDVIVLGGFKWLVNDVLPLDDGYFAYALKLVF